MQYKFEGGLFSPQFWQIIIFFILQSFYFVDTNLPNGKRYRRAGELAEKSQR
jgi:hypothetical protein